MKRNLMLLFLSDVKTNDKGQLSPARYQGIDSVCYTTNESSVKALVSGFEGEPPITFDKIFVFTSDKVHRPICSCSIHTQCDEKRNSVEIFKDDLRPLIPNIDEVLVEQEYHEDNIAVQVMQQTIVDMAQKIQDYVQQYPNDEFVLHADCTGGFRHAILMTLDVVRLMQYNEIEIGQMIYSEYNKGGEGRVQSIKGIYDLYNLTAGAEEFVRFGSVQTINEYFNTPQKCSIELRNLVEAMKTFSSAIKLCHAGTFRDAIDDLHRSLEAFTNKDFAKETDQEQQLNDNLMLQLQWRISHDYQGLWTADDVQIIRWCLQHDYLQQALTLYTEMVPELITGKIFRLTEKGKEALESEKKKGDMRLEEFYEFSVFDPGSQYKNMIDGNRDKYKKEICSLLKKALQTVCDTKSAAAGEEQFKQGTEAINQKYHYEVINVNKDQSFFATMAEMCSHAEYLLKLENHPQVKKLVNAVYQRMDENSQEQYDKLKYGQQKLNKIKKSIQQLKSEKLLKLFPNLAFEAYEPRQCWLQEHGYAEYTVPFEIFKSICRDYDVIRDERNQSNHARKDSVHYDAAYLKIYIGEALDHLDTALQQSD